MQDPEVDGRFIGKLANLSPERRKTFRAVLAAKQAFACCYCKCHMTIDVVSSGPMPKNLATFEHTIDVFASETGRKNDWCENVALACWECNTKRGLKRVKQATRHYSKLFKRRDTLNRLIDHPKIGWAKIVTTFGPLPEPSATYSQRAARTTG
jgi:5-methylcytosine-specific restriction endonuclease McrA